MGVAAAAAAAAAAADLLLLLSADCTRINIMTIIILSCKLKHNVPSKQNNIRIILSVMLLPRYNVLQE